MLPPEKQAEYSAILMSTNQGTLSVSEFIRKIKELTNNAHPDSDYEDADALRALPMMLSEDYLEAYRAQINQKDTWRIILDKI
uniref:Uncharacterized protein n=1 Tax=Caenorhabditis japonica TaxID=281687 RepID=A0A8R1IAL7_CAEJA